MQKDFDSLWLICELESRFIHYASDLSHNRNANKDIYIYKQLKEFLYCPILTHRSENCSSAQTEIVTGDPLWQRDNTLKETEPLCRLDMHSDTTIEEHHHFKVFCYIILVYNGRHFEFVGNFRSRMRFHNISYAVVLILLVIYFFLDLRKDLLYWNKEGEGCYKPPFVPPTKRLDGS